MNIELLLKKCAVRDHGAWEEFTGLYSGLIKRSIRYKAHSLGITLSETDVNDITQETFLSIWDKNKLSTVKDPSSLRGWLAMVSINMTSNYCRRNMFGREKILVSLDSCEIGNNLTMKDILPDAGIST
ncbi:MAG: hypothetical protein KKG84_01125, partial [Candidatus Omnitrophica bacterium]|nr:hypothetical protein [Candidatus Omnitrophota bacterium]